MGFVALVVEYMLGIADWILLACTFTFLSYVLLLTLLSLRARKCPDFSARKLRTFAVIVPAHDEEAGISQTIAAIRAMEYPADRFLPIVVADNCSDATAAVSEKAGARVLERAGAELCGKGYALRWAFDCLLKEEFDAFVVIDADSVPSVNFLSVMNWYLGNGAKVMQSSDLVAPQNRSWSAQMTRIGFFLYNYVRPLGRAAIGGSVGLRGNGMCFSREVLEQVPWNAFSITEDLEYGLLLLLKGYKVKFAHEAVVYAVMPEVAQNAISQRARWEGSRVGLVKTYAWPLIKRALRGPSVACLDAFLDLITPAMVNLIGFSAAIASLHFLLFLFGVEGGGGTRAALWAGCVGLGVVHLFLGLRISGADSSTYRAVFKIPIYALWKVRVYLGMIRKGRRTDWVRTSRE